MGKSKKLLAGEQRGLYIVAIALIILASILLTLVPEPVSAVSASEEISSSNVFQKQNNWTGTKSDVNRQKNQNRHRPPPPGVKIYSDLEYASVDGQSLKLDLYMPENAETPPPLIVWIHGGGWVNGDKAMVNSGAIGLSAGSYAVASLNYRMVGLKQHPKQIHDVKGAIRWLRTHAKTYGYDVTRIGIGGGSAGGHLALLVGLSSNVKALEGDVGGNLDQSSSVQAILNLFGPSELQEYAEVSNRFRQTKAPDPDRLRSASPLTYLSVDDPPLLIMHGEADPVVPLSQSRLLHEKYQQAGLESTLHIIEGAGHGGMVFSDSTRRDMMKAFFDKHLGQSVTKTKGGEGKAFVVASGQLKADAAVISYDKDVSFKTSSLQGFHWVVGPRAGLAGTEKQFNTLLSDIERTLSTNPLISGVYIITHWDLVEPEEGKYDFERLDKVIDLVRRHDRYYKLAIAPGIYSPEWLYRKGSAAFETVGSNPNRKNIYNKPVKIPLPWDPVYQSSYVAMLDKVADRYASDKNFHAVTLTAATFMSPEWHLPHSAADRQKWQEQGNFSAKLENVWQEGIDQFARLFPSQMLILEASSYPVNKAELGDSIVDYGVRTYAGRFAVQINQLTGNFDQINRPTYKKLLDYHKRYGDSIIIGLQNLKGWSFPKIKESQGSMEMTAYNFMQAEGKYWELWYGDGKSRETTEMLHNLLEQGRMLGLKKFKEKLISEGKYNPPSKQR